MNEENILSAENWATLVKDSYLSQIEHSLKAVELFNFEDWFNGIINLWVVIPEQDADKVLLISDKFYIWREMWQGIITCLYEEFLPDFSYEFDWTIEVSPYTLTLCDITKDRRSDQEFQLIKKLLQVTDDDIENDHIGIFEKIGMSRLGLPNGIEGLVPSSHLPSSRLDQLNLLFRLMTFPPLEDLAVFYRRYGEKTNSQIQKISSAFPGIEVEKSAGFTFKGVIGATFFNIDHSTFKRRGLDGIREDLARPEFDKEFEELKEHASALSDANTDVSICPCCGEPQEINLPEETAQFILLMRNRTLARPAALLYVDEFIRAQKTRVVNAVAAVLATVNDVDKPDCMILVEGESEETAIPLMALRSGLHFPKLKIKVFNAKSKQKVASEFQTYRTKFPNMKMICLLDVDAQKEADDIGRMIKDNLDKYHLIHIKEGCFEDLFNLPDSVAVLNTIYPDGEEILIGDFEKGKDFGANIKKILHQKKHASFDKVKFAKLIASTLKRDQFPAEIEEMLKIAEKFTKKQNFIGNR